MKASKALKKLLDTSGLRRPLGRLISPEFREIHRITTEVKMDFQRRGFDGIYQGHINGQDGYKKYLDLENALEPAIKWLLHLGLLDCPPLRIFDIGCGPGYFLYLAKH